MCRRVSPIESTSQKCPGGRDSGWMDGEGGRKQGGRSVRKREGQEVERGGSRQRARDWGRVDVEQQRGWPPFGWGR